jgi:hypothetical protein
MRADQEPAGGPVTDKAILQIDNTTLHRLQKIVEFQPGQALPDPEVANILHLLECLILGQQLSVNSFEYQASQAVSDRWREWLDGTDLTGLVRTSPLSAPDMQRDIAANVAREMAERGFIGGPLGQDHDLTNINIAVARPSGTVEVAAEFWESVILNGAAADEVKQRAAECVETYRTDGLFVYGVAQHADLIGAITRRDPAERGLTTADWNRLHVIFRTLFNQHMSDEQKGVMYAPPPGRARVLRHLFLPFPTERLDAEAVKLLAVLANQEQHRDLEEDVIVRAREPLPLLGLAFMLAARKRRPRASIESTLSTARDLAEPMRKRIAQLAKLASDHSSDYRRESKAEAEAFREVVQGQLGLTEVAGATGLDIEVDGNWAIDLDEEAINTDLRVPFKLVDVARRAGNQRRQTARVCALSDGLTQSLRYSSVKHALTAALQGR